MVFSSIPVYLDPPNWPQQCLEGGGSENPQLPPLVPPPEGGRTARPGTTTERARLAKLPQPETAQKCPRCESTNTKFCYFNNYSLSQPRHFCKTCRRYWTRGGALRNVPVGGGCRRNKKRKGSRSKSPVTAERQGGDNSIRAGSSNSCTSDMICYLPPSPTQLPFLPSLNHFSNYGAGDVGLTFGGIQPPVVVAGGGDGVAEQWRMQQVQQFPFLAGLEQPPAGMYQFEGEVTETLNYMGGGIGQSESKALDSGVDEVKMEANQGLTFSRNFLGIPGNNQYWGSNGWNDLSGFTSSSTTHLF